MNKERLKALLSEYGAVAIWTYFVLFGLVLTAFAVAIAAGVRVESAQGHAGVLAGAWIATKLTQPLRILASLALTPVVARVAGKLRRRKSEPGPSA